MSISVGGGEFYPGQSFSVSQLLYATKKKLKDSTSGGRITTTLNETEVNALEHDALEVLSFIRSLKNTFAPINRIPPEVLSLIPNCREDSREDGDEALIKMTHVCRDWREVFIPRASLWTRLDCKNVDKTRVYVERSKSSPLEVYFRHDDDVFFDREAFLLAVPHLHRFKTLSASGDPVLVFPTLVKHFSCPVPLLSKLEINFNCNHPPTLPDELLNGDLSSLRELSLTGVITSLPWRGLPNLTTFSYIPQVRILLTQLLDFFESAPHLRHIQLRGLIPESSNAPAERVVPLPHLKELSIIAHEPECFILLNHLSIPAGASLRLKLYFSGKESPIQSYLSKSLDNFYNLSHITAVSLCFGSDRRFMRLHGPSGELRVLGDWWHGDGKHNAGTTRFIGSLRQFDISRTRQLAITRCSYKLPTVSLIATSASNSILRRMRDLRTLVLAQCKNLVFIHTLNPAKNPSGIALCPELEEIILYIKRPDEFHIDELLSMAAERELRGVKLLAITIISTDALSPPKQEVFQLREYVSRVEYRFDDALPEWDALLS